MVFEMIFHLFVKCIYWSWYDIISQVIFHFGWIWDKRRWIVIFITFPDLLISFSTYFVQDESGSIKTTNLTPCLGCLFKVIASTSINTDCCKSSRTRRRPVRTSAILIHGICTRGTQLWDFLSSRMICSIVQVHLVQLESLWWSWTCSIAAESACGVVCDLLVGRHSLLEAVGFWQRTLVWI